MSAGNSAYSPLPQSNSDSDCSSEEELHASEGNRIVNRAARVQNLKVDKTLNEVNNVNYKLLDNDGDIEVTLNKFHQNSDEVSIVKPDDSLEIFSTSRKICFVLSLLLCVFTTVAFLWILPCNVGSCPSTSDLKKYNFTWKEDLPNIEIYGPISLVPDINGNQNLVFLTRSFVHSRINYLKNGLKCLKGRDGSFIWEYKLKEEPIDVDCKLFDINNDGFSDCLIYGSNFLTAVDSSSGKKLWDILEANKNEYKISFKDFPLVIPDLDEDEVKELLLLCSYKFLNKSKQEKNTLQNNLIIISGKTGVIINEPLQLKLCSVVENLVLEKNSVLSYTCIFDKKESFQKINLTNVLKPMKNWSVKKTNQLKEEILKQHKRALDTLHVNGFKLVLKNQGNCPEDCHVFVDIKDEHESLNKTIYTFNQKNTFAPKFSSSLTGMTPVVLNNQNETIFVIKFWKWNSKAENPKFQEFTTQKTVIKRNNTKNVIKRSKKLNGLLDNSKILENKILLESDYEFQRKKRTAIGPQKNKLKRNVFANSLHIITETIIKINLNPQLSLHNLTQDEIIQICNKKHENCQPNVRHQKHSILPAQLLAEGEEMLVTFNSKYVHDKKGRQQKFKGWQLLSTIRVFDKNFQ